MIPQPQHEGQEVLLDSTCEFPPESGLRRGPHYVIQGLTPDLHYRKLGECSAWNTGKLLLTL